MGAPGNWHPLLKKQPPTGFLRVPRHQQHLGPGVEHQAISQERDSY